MDSVFPGKKVEFCSAVVVVLCVMVSALALGKAKALKEACLEAAKESVDVAKNATGRRFEPHQTHFLY